MKELDIIIDENGDLHFVYDDELADVFYGEDVRTTRASHVEPHPSGNGWTADMRPMGGPILFGDNRECWLNGASEWPGFPTRAEALAAEREWLRKERGL